MHTTTRATSLTTSAILVAALAVPCGAAIKPRPTIDRMCQDVPLIVEGVHEGAGVVRITHTFTRPEGFAPADGTIDVARLERHDMRTGQPWAKERRSMPARHVVLFLEKTASGAWESLFTLEGDDGSGTVGSSGVFWIDDEGLCHAYSQCINPGPYQLLAAGESAGPWLPTSVEALRDEITSGVGRASAWRGTLGTPAGEERARRLALYLSPETSPDGDRETRLLDVPAPLAECGSAGAEVLREFLAEKRVDGGVVAALRTAALLGPDAAPLVSLIAPHIPGENVTITAEAIEALGATEAPAALPPLRAALGDERFWVVVRAAKALARLRDRESFDAIAARLPEEPQSDHAGPVSDLLLCLDTLDAERAAPLLDRHIALPAMASTVRFLRAVRAGAYRAR